MLAWFFPRVVQLASLPKRLFQQAASGSGAQRKEQPHAGGVRGACVIAGLPEFVSPAVRCLTSTQSDAELAKVVVGHAPECMTYVTDFPPNELFPLIANYPSGSPCRYGLSCDYPKQP